jgi:ribonuclease J
MIKIFPMGGIGGVTKNMFLYEYDQEILIIDCGIGFPDNSMPGVEFLIPDTAYLRTRLEQGAHIVGMVLTHGHDDHIAALPYVLRELDVDFPIYGSPLTAEFAMARMADNGIDKRVEHFAEGEITLGSFRIETIKITHSVPDTRHLAIHTPEGIIYHGSDYKIDLTPVDGIVPEFQKMARVGQEGILCALMDCLRIERTAPTQSESAVGPALRREMFGVKGKVMVTLMSSNLHRVQQVIDVAAEYGRKVTFVGRSVEQNVNLAMEMGILHFPANFKLNKRNIDKVPDSELCVIIAGSQGQPGSSLVRAVSGSHRNISIQKGDKIIFSSEPIPGSETDVYKTINEIALQGVEVVYSDIEDDLHVSGHASAYEQMFMAELLRPKFLFPIGGEERHRVQYSLAAQEHGYRPSEIVLPHYGKIVEFDHGEFRYGEEIELKDRMVDSSGVSDVVAHLLDERQVLGEHGVVVVSLVEENGNFDPREVAISMRGFSQDTPEVATRLQHVVQDNIGRILNNVDTNDPDFRKEVERQLSGIIHREFGRAPLVMVIVTSRYNG